MPAQRSLSVSITLHALVLLFAAFGLPALLPKKDRDIQPMVMTVDILPISAITNVRPSEKIAQKLEEAAASKNEKPSPPTVQEQPKPPSEPKAFDPNEGAEPKPADEAKPQEKPKEDEFAKLLSKLNQEAKAEPKKETKDTASAETNPSQSDAPYDESLPLSLSEKDAIRNQFIKCWRMPAGSKDVENLVVRLLVELNPDGSLISSTLASDQTSRYTSDPFFRAAVDAAKRAVVQCTQPPLGPLQNLPADKYGSWRSMELNFDPSQLLY